MMAAVKKVDVFVNGKPVAVCRDTSILGLLAQLQINHPAIAVELNSKIQPGNLFETTMLRDGDSLEIVSLAGGG